jgi:hypothetical protein
MLAKISSHREMDGDACIMAKDSSLTCLCFRPIYHFIEGYIEMLLDK